MTNQEYTRYTGTSYMSKTTNRALAIKGALNKHNLGKVKVIMLDGETGTYGVVQNSIAKKFLAAGYEELHIGFADMVHAN